VACRAAEIAASYRKFVIVIIGEEEEEKALFL